MEGLGALASAPPHPLSFHDLPVELRLKCLANCDWKTLSVAACVNRGTRALVRVPAAAGRRCGQLRSAPPLRAFPSQACWGCAFASWLLKACCAPSRATCLHRHCDVCPLRLATTWGALRATHPAPLLHQVQVEYLVRAPYWRTHTEQQPAVLTTDFASAEERQQACDNWAVRAGGEKLSCGGQGRCCLRAATSGRDRLTLAELCAKQPWVVSNTGQASTSKRRIRADPASSLQ